MRRAACVFVVAGAMLPACQIVLNIEGKELVGADAGDATTAGNGGSPTDGGSGDGTITTEDGATVPAPICNGTENFQENGKHCGRCGHDCLGGVCTAGVCEKVTLA